MIFNEASGRETLPTPSLLIDLDRLDANIGTMMAGVQAMGVALRPHAKSHKCPDVARRLIASGAIGTCCATIGEAEVMARAGLPGILITSPMTAPHMVAGVRRLLLKDADVLLVVDNHDNVAALSALAASIGKRIRMVVELDVGVGRTGCLRVADAVALARRIGADSNLYYAGIQAYWGNLQQVMPYQERERRVMAQAEKLRELIAALTAAGLPPPIVTGSGTGTFAIDGMLGLFTKLQPGSFLFLDSCYGVIPLSANGNDFKPSLFVLASVVSANRPGRAIINAGFKAFATDSGLPVPLRGAPPGATYRYMGDEHGAVEYDGDTVMALGSSIELLVSHCDPTVNLHACFQVMRGNQVVDRWPILARGYDDVRQ